MLHDIKLVGDSQVKHQIDVTLIDGGAKRRVLIECKDFDVSADRVGLGIIRDFSAVVEDAKPDEAIVITCVGFTRDAQKFAKHKGIKLAVLREFEKRDLTGLIGSINLNVYVQSVSSPQIAIEVVDDADGKKLLADMQAEGLQTVGFDLDHPVFVEFGGVRTHIHTFVLERANAHPRDVAGPVRLRVPDGFIEVGSRGRIPLDALVVEFEVRHYEERIQIMSNKVARLILEGFEGKDLIVFEDDLQRLSIDDATGEVF